MCEDGKPCPETSGMNAAEKAAAEGYNKIFTDLKAKSSADGTTAVLASVVSSEFAKLLASMEPEHAISMAQDVYTASELFRVVRTFGRK